MLLTHICGIRPQSVTAQVPMKRPWDMWANDLHISKYDDINTAIAYRIGCMEKTVKGNYYFVQANSFIDTWDDIILHHCSYIYIFCVASLSTLHVFLSFQSLICNCYRASLDTHIWIHFSYMWSLLLIIISVLCHYGNHESYRNVYVHVYSIWTTDSCFLRLNDFGSAIDHS